MQVKRCHWQSVNTYTKLDSEYDTGTSIVMKKDGEVSHAKIVNTFDNKIIVLGFAGIMSIIEKNSSIPIPIKFDVKVGDQVFFSHLDGFKRGNVKKINYEIGRVDMIYDDNGEVIMESVLFGDVIKKIEFK